MRMSHNLFFRCKSSHTHSTHFRHSSLHLHVPLKKQIFSLSKISKKSFGLHAPHVFMEDTAWMATLSKIVSNTIIYPLETCKMLLQTMQEIPWHRPHVLFAGYSQFILYNICHSSIYYSIFYNTFNAFQQCIWTSSLITALITSLYKVPITYYLRNTAVLAASSSSTSKKKLPTLSWSTLQESLCWKRYVVLVCEDIPDTVIKFSLNAFLKTLPWISSAHIPLWVGICTSLLLMPIDHLKTTLFCQMHLAVTKNVMAGLRFRLFASVLNTTLFTGCLNALQQALC